MQSQRKRLKQATMFLGGGLVFINIGECLPKDYWYNFWGAGRATVLNTFAETVFTSVTDTLFPGSADDGNGEGNGDGSGETTE